MNNFTTVPIYRNHSDRVVKLSEEQEARSVGEGGRYTCGCAQKKFPFSRSLECILNPTK